MRTTLKRGLGRGAAANGNGRAVLPPSVLTTMTRYRQPPRRHGALHAVGRILLAVVASVLMLAAAFVGGTYLFFHESVAAVRAHTAELKLAEKRLQVALPGRPAIALVIGYDYRPEEGPGFQSRSDTIMLVRADPQTDTISTLSFPRDLLVEIRCPGRYSFVGKINSAFAECREEGALETVKALTGLPINYLVKINFRGFKQIIDRLDGVWIDVDRRYFNNNAGVAPGYTYARIDLEPGYQRLNGSQALDFVRYRHTDSDVHRLARQQLFVRALRAQVADSFPITSLPRLVGVVTNNVEIGQGGKELSGRTILGWALFAYKLPPGHVFHTKLEGLVGTNELTVDPASLEAAVDEFVTPDVEAPKKATAAALGRRYRPSRIRPADISITVLNGNGVPGSAANAAYELRHGGYRIPVPPTGARGNAPSWDYETTKVYFDPAQAGSQRAAAQVAKLFGTADVGRLPSSLVPLGNGAMLVVVVGQSFDGSLESSPADRTPPRQPPAIVRNPSLTLPLVRSYRKKVDFRLQVPTVLEKTSSLDTERPVRLYELEGHKALRLTFRTGSAANEYWGIQQTDWEEAPILADKNVRQVIRGRVYDLYYSGSRLHMVVLREHGATYWVVNTLLNSLSNETMLAIARGLRPLRK